VHSKLELQTQSRPTPGRRRHPLAGPDVHLNRNRGSLTQTASAEASWETCPCLCV
jgi:hypothetical protein